jgi:hypothetical protein
LRPAARLWEAAARGCSQLTSDERTRAALAACDGLLWQGLIADEPPDADEIARTLEHLLERLNPDSRN